MQGNRWRDTVSALKDADQLVSHLHRIDGRGYKAYRNIQGGYRIGEFALYVDYVQGDPFAPPSRMRIRLEGGRAGFPGELYDDRDRRVALEDYILRAFDAALGQQVKGRRGSGKSGVVVVDRPGQQVLERTAVVVDPRFVEVRLSVGLPARGRRVLGRQAQAMLLDEVPAAARAAMFYRQLDDDRIRRFVCSVQDAAVLRRQLPQMSSVGFVADGAILPRKSGVSEAPLPSDAATPFESPPSLRGEVTLANGRRVTGMLVPEGVTLIVGGGYHGKSTLLAALDRGIYDHVPEDGRELVVSRESAVKIRAEDGRQVTGVDISPFIRNLPDGGDTTSFSTPAASGSTSQAANIMEALEMGSQLLLIDEDTSATNFMVRDMRMQKLVSAEKEPITPFIDRARQLYRERGVSTVLVVGGSGDYFDVADTVIMMDHYRPYDVTDRALEIAERYPTGRVQEPGRSLCEQVERHPDPASIDARRRGRVRVRSRDVSTIQFGEENIDLSMVEQLVDSSQTRAVADMILYLKRHFPRASNREALQLAYRDLRDEGLDVISPFSGHPGDYARPRRFEVASALNRLRSLRLEQREHLTDGGG